MIIDILFILAVLLYWTFEGWTERATWRMAEPAKKAKIVGEYHAKRLLETTGIFIALACFSPLWLVTGSWILGYVAYEAVITLGQDYLGAWYRRIWVKPYNYQFLRKRFKQPSRKVFFLLIIIGLGLITLHFWR